ncbi:MAG: ribosome rescue GTPase HflX [Pseudomonadales bacterium]
MFFDRQESGELAVLVHVDLRGDQSVSPAEEFIELARSAGATACGLIEAHNFQPHSYSLVRSGKLAEIADMVKLEGAELVIFSHTLSPSQQRNLEAELSCRVIDRTGLILDIFAQRARTHEGKLQVELAQLSYVATRLVRGWTHLERQKGGIGLRGPGETQLETDRRLIRVRIKSIEARLDKVQRQRSLGRRARKRSSIPTVSLVGYTNAGKSTLFNQMCDANVFAADQLFATLDPTLRRIEVDELGPVVLADTVGFIRDLPHKLVDAFKATLEETIEADLLLHIVDASDDARDDNINAVNQVLADIGAADIPVLLVYNKIDQVEELESHTQLDSNGKPERVYLSALRNRGLEHLAKAIADLLGEDVVHGRLSIAGSQAQARLRACLYEHKSVLNESYDEQGQSVLEIRAPEADLRRWLKAENIGWDQVARI